MTRIICHQSELFTWVGFANFVKLFTNSVTSTFGYAFRKILGWTFLWAVLATLTTFIGGILLAMLINSRLVKVQENVENIVYSSYSSSTVRYTSFGKILLC